MKQLFVDTSAWYAMVDPGDSNHVAAITYRDEIARKYKLVITNYILDELYTLLLVSFGYRKVINFKSTLDILTEQKILEVIFVSETIEQETWKIFAKYNVDKFWSFTDYVSYVVMKQRGIREVFTFDHHFTQMGFICRL